MYLKKKLTKVIVGLWRRTLKYYAKEYRETDEYAQLIEEDF